MSNKKTKIRSEIWERMDKENVVKFPKPVEGRIPNFKGAKKAARNLTDISTFQRATHVKVNPDSPQHPVRTKVISEGKVLYMPTPRLREGFLQIRPEDVPSGKEDKATTIKHSNKFGEKIEPGEIEDISLVVAGSVAVTEDGRRLGKGGGYSDLEYAILTEVGLGTPPILTTVHPIQIVRKIPMEKHDISLDWIVTPEKIIETGTKLSKPDCIDWSLLNEADIRDIPLLKKLKNY